LRQAVVAEAEKVGMRDERLADLKTAVSEACSNVVLHAYAGREQPGPIEVEITAGQDAVTTVVRDFGRGLRPAVSRRSESLGLGLSLIGALSTCFQLRSGHDRGTEIMFQVPLRGEPSLRTRVAGSHACAEVGLNDSAPGAVQRRDSSGEAT
jgi:serine/threonine-protein kinase RsbW